MLDHSALGSRVDGGVLQLINSGAYITYWGGNVFPVYDVAFGGGAGLTGKVSEVVGCYAYNGVNVTNVNASSPVLARNNFALATLATSTPYKLTPPRLQFSNSASELQLSWPGDIGYFGLWQTGSLTPPVAWAACTNPPLFLSNSWRNTLPILTTPRYFRLEAP
jgi:hypothetical protein